MILSEFHLVCLGVLPSLSFEFNFVFDVRIVSVRKARPLSQRLRLLPSRIGCNSIESFVMGEFTGITELSKKFGM